MPTRTRSLINSLPLIALVLGACSTRTTGPGIQASPAPVTREITAAPATAFAAVPEDSVEVHDVAESLPAEAVSVAQFTVPDSLQSGSDEEILAIYRLKAARLGAKWISLSRTGGRRRIDAYHIPSTRKVRIAADSTSRVQATTGATTTSSAPSNGSGSVQVRSYCRRNGSCVRSHTRARPGSGSRPSSRSRGGSRSRRRG